MPLPESFDSNTFDAVNLWHVTESLVRVLPGLHIARISEPADIYRDYRRTAFKIFWSSPEVEGAKVSLSQQSFKGSTSDTYEMHYRIRETMGDAVVCEEMTSDAAPEKADQRAQQELMNLLLPRVDEVTITRKTSETLKVEVGTGSADSQDTLIFVPSISSIRRRSEWIGREYVLSIANFNVRLAGLVEEDVALYENIAKLAETWAPAPSLPPSLGWLHRPEGS